MSRGRAETTTMTLSPLHLRRGWPFAAPVVVEEKEEDVEHLVVEQLLGRCGRWRGGAWDARVTGPASTTIRRFRLSRAVIFLLISCWLCLGATAATAASISVDESPRPTTETRSTHAADEVLLIDPRIPVFVDGHWQIMSNEEHRELRRRADAAQHNKEA